MNYLIISGLHLHGLLTAYYLISGSLPSVLVSQKKFIRILQVSISFALTKLQMKLGCGLSLSW